MRIVYCLFCFLLLSCVGDNQDYEIQEQTTTKERMQIEICHNPESSNHKLECTALDRDWETKQTINNSHVKSFLYN